MTKGHVRGNDQPVLEGRPGAYRGTLVPVARAAFGSPICPGDVGAAYPLC